MDTIGRMQPYTIVIHSADCLDADEKANSKLGFGSDATIINESGLYSVILTSRKQT